MSPLCPNEQPFACNQEPDCKDACTDGHPNPGNSGWSLVLVQCPDCKPSNAEKPDYQTERRCSIANSCETRNQAQGTQQWRLGLARTWHIMEGYHLMPPMYSSRSENTRSQTTTP